MFFVDKQKKTCYNSKQLLDKGDKRYVVSIQTSKQI